MTESLVTWVEDTIETWDKAPIFAASRTLQQEPVDNEHDERYRLHIYRFLSARPYSVFQVNRAPTRDENTHIPSRRDLN